MKPHSDIRLTIDLRGPDGNAFVVMAKIAQALELACRKDLVEQYRKEAKSGDYENLLEVGKKYVRVKYVR